MKTGIVGKARISFTRLPGKLMADIKYLKSLDIIIDDSAVEIIAKVTR